MASGWPSRGRGRAAPGSPEIWNIWRAILATALSCRRLRMYKPTLTATSSADVTDQNIRSGMIWTE